MKNAIHLVIFEYNGNFGLWDADRQNIYLPPKYENTFHYRFEVEGFTVSKEGKQGLFRAYNAESPIIIPCIYDEISIDTYQGYFDHLFLVINEGKLGLHSTIKNETILNTEYDRISFWPENEAFFQIEKEKKIGLFEYETGFLIPAIHDEIVPEFNFEGIELHGDSVSGLITYTGDTIIPPFYDEIELQEEEVYMVKQNGLYGLYSAYSAGDTILEPKYESIKWNKTFWGFDIEKDGKKGAFSQELNVFIEAEYDKLEYLDDLSLFLYSIEDKWGAYWQDRSKKYPVEYDKIEYNRKEKTIYFYKGEEIEKAVL